MAAVFLSYVLGQLDCCVEFLIGGYCLLDQLLYFFRLLVFSFMMHGLYECSSLDLPRSSKLPILVQNGWISQPKHITDILQISIDLHFRIVSRDVLIPVVLFLQIVAEYHVHLFQLLWSYSCSYFSLLVCRSIIFLSTASVLKFLFRIFVGLGVLCYSFF